MLRNPSSRVLRDAPLALLALALTLGAGPAPAAPVPPAGTARRAEEPAGEAPAAANQIDLEYVKTHLEHHLKPTSIQFLENGRVRLAFDFQRKEPAHAGIFTPAVAKDVQKNFRWTVRGEEYYSSFYSSRRQLFKGLRLGNHGLALLNCWFRDDVEAEIRYAQGMNFLPRHLVAPAFFNDRQRGLGSNYGSQCVFLSKWAAGKRRGDLESLVMDEEHRFKIKVRGGTFEAHRDGAKRAEAEYSDRTFSSGRIGFAWSGGIAGVITHLEIEGTLDVERMASYLRKRRR